MDRTIPRQAAMFPIAAELVRCCLHPTRPPTGCSPAPANARCRALSLAGRHGVDLVVLCPRGEHVVVVDVKGSLRAGHWPRLSHRDWRS
jgi:hypothetical protein